MDKARGQSPCQEHEGRGAVPKDGNAGHQLEWRCGRAGRRRRVRARYTVAPTVGRGPLLPRRGGSVQPSQTHKPLVFMWLDRL